jgi:hypothetical protein
MDTTPAVAPPIPEDPAVPMPLMTGEPLPAQPAQNSSPYAAQATQRRRRACLCFVEECSRSRMTIALQKIFALLDCSL